MPVNFFAAKGKVLAAAGVALVASALFAPTLRHGFALDDAPEVVRNEQIRSLTHVPDMFSSGAWDGAGERNPIYRPLTTVTYALNYLAGGLEPWGYHAVNVLLHALVSVLVVAVALQLRLSLGGAVLAGLLFAVHPLHVEVVGNVAGRKDELAALFTLGTLLAHVLARRRGRAWGLPALAAFAAALFSKESGAAALGLVSAWDLFLDEGGWRDRARRALPRYAAYAAVFGLYLVARRAAVGSFGVPLDKIPFVENPLAHVGAGPRLMTAVAVLGKGLWLHLWPHPLSPDYSFDAIPVVTSAADPRFLVAAAAILACAAAALALWRSRPLWPFLAAWYLAGVLAASNLLVPVGTIFGERLLYLSSAAVCVGAGALLAPLLARRPRVVGAAAASAALLLAGVTASYSRAWADEVSLFTAAVEAYPASAKSHDLLAAAFMEEGRTEEGLRELQTAVRLLEPVKPTPAGTLVKLGVAYERAGRLGEAAGVYEGILRDDPGYPDALWRLGVVRWGESRPDDAVALWRRTLAAAPGHARAMTELGFALQQRGDVAGAEALWLQAVRADPRAPGAWLALGNLYAQRGDAQRAKAAWERFVEEARYGAYPREREAVMERLRGM